MSQTISNLYASQVFAEHPIALWSLDEDFSFINILSSEDQDLSNWTILNGTASAASINEITGVDQRTLPIGESFYSVSKSASTTVTTVELPYYVQYSDTDPNKKSVSFNTWFLAPTTVESIEMWLDISGSSSYSSSANFENSSPTKWSFASHSVEMSSSANFNPYLKINHLTESAGVKTYFNGMSLGQWSELYARETSGTNVQDLLNTDLSNLISTASSNYSVSEVLPYGFNDLDIGYYFINRNKMLANNTSLPMVFGSGNITRINAPVDQGVPSIAIPGKTFLNEYGKYKNLTLEFWARIQSNSSTPIRIFGPLANNDGLYVDKEFITLSVGPYTKSYFVGKWYRPMLLDIRYTSSNISLLINGDLVIDLNIDVENIVFSNPEQDWLGFFGNENSYPFEVDSVSIFPYLVPEQIAKRRFVYAQAVENPEEIISDFKGESFFVDFPFAKYTNTMTYPDTNPWESGFTSNLSTNSRYLSFPEYSLPELRLVDGGSQTINNFLSDNYDIQDEEYAFIKMRPDEGYDDIDVSLYFNNINPISSTVESIFGVFKAPNSLPTYENKESIMTFKNAINSNTFTINISDQGITYEFFDGVLNSVIETVSASANQYIYLGFDLEEITKKNYAKIENFFTNTDNVSLSLGGYGSNIFTGKIFSLTFNNKMFTIKDLSDYIQSKGTIQIPQEAINSGAFNPFLYVGNYTFLPTNAVGETFFDIGCSGYWEDSLPLSFFGKYVKNANQTPFYDLDLLQFNIDVPSRLTFDTTQDMQNDDVYFSTKNINTFITLQSFSVVGTVPYTNYEITERLSSNKVLDLQPQFSTLTKKFEVLDGTVIYPPKELIDFENYYITIHMEVRSRGIISKPVKLKRMSISSLAYDETNEYHVGTRSGHEIIPFSRNNLNYNYKAKNPFLIYKDSTPYLYLTGDSGICSLPYESSLTRGLSFDINDHKALNYKLTGLQLWMFYNKSEIIESTHQIATIIVRGNSGNGGVDQYYDIYLVPEPGGRRGSLKVYKDNILYQNATFFINGKIVKDMRIVPLEWTSVLISFTDVTDITLDGVKGSFEVYDGLWVNNIAFFQQEFVNFFDKLVTGNQWTILENEQWDYPTQNINPETGSQYTWREIGNIQITDIVSQTGDSTFKTYLGLAEQIFDDTDVVVTNSDGFDATTGVSWSNSIVRAV